LSARAQIAVLPDGRRHFHDGPIDLVLEASGAASERAAAYDAAAARFATILDELCLELPRLRAAVGPHPEGAVARRMASAVAPFAAERFLTPMAAVAGAVAEEVLAAMVAAAQLDRAYVNNGGDIALHLTPKASFAIGLIARVDRPSLFGKARLTGRDAPRGLATSGWRGRSFSLGIADAATVIAPTAALADAAATLIANAVDLPGHPAVSRAPARTRDPQSDLGDREVTLAVGPLSGDDIEIALDRGESEARLWLDRGVIAAAALSLNGRTRLVGANASLYKLSAPPVEPEPRHAVG
jgi:ApbE superfamily uncharacterized protein (UPF0280 family)